MYRARQQQEPRQRGPPGGNRTSAFQGNRHENPVVPCSTQVRGSFMSQARQHVLLHVTHSPRVMDTCTHMHRSCHIHVSICHTSHSGTHIHCPGRPQGHPGISTRCAHRDPVCTACQTYTSMQAHLDLLHKKPHTHTLISHARTHTAPTVLYIQTPFAYPPTVENIGILCINVYDSNISAHNLCGFGC